jgi:hypothetical protein
MLAGCGTTPTDTTPPAAPTGLKAEAGDTKIVLSWQANTEADLKGYLVSWRESVGGASSSSEAITPQFTVSGLTNDKTYFVTVAAVDKSGNKSVASSPAVASPKAAPIPAQPPAKPKGLTATAQDGQVALNWTPNPETDLKRYTIRYGTSTNLDQSLLIDAPATSAVVVGLTNGTAYSFALEAESTKGLTSVRSDAVSVTPKAVPRAPTVQEIALTGYGLSNQVRQGAGDLEINLKGSNLETLSSAKLGSYDLTVQSKAADAAKLTVNVPHGAALGALDLTVQNGAGTLTRSAAVEITKITTATKPELNPSDTDGKGTPNRPFRTLTKALSVSGKGDTVLLTAGIYSAGEIWPGSSAADDPPNVPDGVSIEGQSSDRGTVVLQGPEVGLGNLSGLLFAGNADARNLTLRGFKYALFYGGNPSNPSGDLTFDNVAASANFDGLHVRYAANLTVTNSLFSTNGKNGVGGSGLYLIGVGQARISATQLNTNVYGLTIEGSGEVRLEGLGVKANRLEGITVNNTTLTLSDSVVEENLGTGVSVGMRSFPRAVSISRVVSRNNGSHGFIVGGQPRTVSVYQCEFYGNKAWQFYDLRDANNPDPLYAFFSKLEGLSPENIQPSLSSGTGSAELRPDGLNLVRIENPGNAIYFTL